MGRSWFQVETVPLADPVERWGTVSLLPLDLEAFGFASAEVKPVREVLVAEPDEFARRFQAWAGPRDVRLACGRVRGTDPALAEAWRRAGFHHVESTLLATLGGKPLGALPEPRIAVRRATADDREAVTRIGGSIFRHGRYHCDGRFPRERADHRYALWLAKAFVDPAPGTAMFVIGPQKEPVGFFYTELAGGVAGLKLVGIDPERDPGFAAHALFLGTMKALAADGAKRAVARFSASNTPVLNLYASLGFHFSDPEEIHHWHAEREGS